MTNSEKIKMLNELDTTLHTAKDYLRVMDSIGALHDNYIDYMIIKNIGYNDGLKMINEADFELCSVLITYQIRREHFKKGAFNKACKAGKVQPIIDRMTALLEAEAEI